MGLSIGWFGFLRNEILVPLGIVVAALTTVHVLLRKHETNAAVGWIGLSWLAPFSGTALYLMFGINRVRRRAIRLRAARRRPAVDVPPAPERDDHFARLETATRRITRRPAEGGNAITLFRNGDEAYPPMREAIDAARTSVAVSTYILRDDPAGGGPFLDALIAAHRRGVAVRVLMDGIGSGWFRSPPYARLTEAGVPAARFLHSPLPWRMPFLNLRTHRKILLLDGEHAFTGGMNLAGENVLASRPRHPVRDVHFHMRGPVVAQLAEAFATDWAFATDETLSGPAWFPGATGGRRAEAGDATARVVTSGPDEDLEKIEFVVMQAVSAARESVRVMTPYFLPDERVVTALALASQRGVEVDVLIPARSNHVFVDWATRAALGPLLKEGVRIWLGPPPFDHGKAMVVDGRWCFVGSANWDVRSFRLNFELNVEVYHDKTAGRLDALIRSDCKERLTPEMLAARSIPRRLRDAAARLLQPYL